MTRQGWTLAVGLAAIVVAIVGGSCSTNARITGLAIQISAQIDGLRTDVRNLDGRVRALDLVHPGERQPLSSLVVRPPASR